MGGRRPKPTNLKILHGNPGKRTLPQHEPKPIIRAEPAPDWLPAEGRELWGELCPLLVRLRVFTEADRAALELTCATWAQWRQAARVIAEQGNSMIVDGEHGVVVLTRPEVRIASDAARRLRLLLGEFGLTPSSRARVSTAGAEQEVDPMEELLGERGA